MTVLVPDAVRVEDGLTIHEKIIPWGTVWPKAAPGFAAGAPYKADALLSEGTGRAKGVCVHNTGRITVPPCTTEAEQYTRATWPNANMGSVRVHYYVDSVCAWQNLREDEVGWHAGDGTHGPGNNTTLSVEIIMDGSGDARDAAARTNGAHLVALLLRRHGLTISDVTTHYALSPVKKYCPQYLLPHWTQFLLEVHAWLCRPDTAENAELLPPDRLPAIDGDGGAPPAAGAAEALEDVPDADADPPRQPFFYRVQVGAFLDPDNARTLLLELENAGFRGYIRT